jgi:hypothetical protein
MLKPMFYNLKPDYYYLNLPIPPELTNSTTPNCTYEVPTIAKMYQLTNSPTMAEIYQLTNLY